MPRLMLLRHAKSTWTGQAIADFDRSLNERGRRAAALMGHHMADHNLIPDRIICSSAQRARETLAGLIPYFSRPMDIDVSRPLYDAMNGDYIDHIHALGDNAETLLLIGHNSAMQDTAIKLAGSGNPELLTGVSEKYPTATLAVIDFEARDWSTITAGSGRLVAYVRPRDLAANDVED